VMAISWVMKAGTMSFSSGFFSEEAEEEEEEEEEESDSSSSQAQIQSDLVFWIR